MASLAIVECHRVFDLGQDSLDLCVCQDLGFFIFSLPANLLPLLYDYRLGRGGYGLVVSLLAIRGPKLKEFYRLKHLLVPSTVYQQQIFQTNLYCFGIFVTLVD